MTTSAPHTYWPVNKEFLNSNSDQQFTLFLKDTNPKIDMYVKFAGPDPVHQGKVRRMLNEGKLQNNLYIHKNEMQEYFLQATEKIHDWEKRSEGDPDTFAEKLHGLAQEIMKGFFEFNVSAKVLQSMDPIMEKMMDCITQSENRALIKTLSKDFSLYNHCINVGLYCVSFGVISNMKPEEIHTLGLGGLFCDIGMTRVSREITSKKGALTTEEVEEVKTHISSGLAILAELKFENKAIAEILEYHHEEFQGRGYPKGLTGAEIPHNARICKIMDMYDALTSPRPYRKGFSPMEAFTLMATECRAQFDPDMLKQFILMMGPSLE